MDWELFEAATSGDLDFLHQTEADKLDSEVTVHQKNTVLHIAVNSKRKEFAKQVLGLRSSLLRKANKKGDTPLHVAARIGCSELAQLLIDSTARTQHADVEGQEVNVLRMVNLEKKETALHVAVRNGHLDVVKLLMEADLGLLDLVNTADQSPLSLAVLQEFPNIVLHILETSPSSPCGGTNGIHALHFAAIDKRHGLMEIPVKIRPEMIKEADIFGRTPLHYAAFRDHLQAVRLLLKCDRSAAYLSDKDEMSPLHVAAYRSHVDVAQELIKYCPYIWESVDEKSRTALHVAIIAGKEEMVKYILGVPELVGLINEPDKEGNTPLHLAAVCEKYIILSILACEERVDKQAMNNEFLTAMDIFCSKKPKYSSAVRKVNYLLKRNYGILYRQRWIDTNLREGMEGEAAEKRKSDSVTGNEGPDESKRSMFEGHLLVAALIATVTFAAAFTMPGGYKSEGRDQGTPNFIDRAAFKVFVIFDTIAFSYSVTAVYLLFHSSYDGCHNHPKCVDQVLSCIYKAMGGMVLAFVTGIHVMLAKSIGLAIAAYLMAGYFFLGFFIDWFFNPRGQRVSAIGWPWELLKLIWELLKKLLKIKWDNLRRPHAEMKLFYFE